MQITPIRIRAADTSDCWDLWSWRNDSLARDMSINKTHISYAEHSHWFSRSLLSPDVVLYIAFLSEDVQKKVAMCRFDISRPSRTAYVSINLNPIMRGNRYGALVLVECLKRLANNESDLLITAEILRCNHASVKSFERAGFRLSQRLRGSDDHLLSYVISI